MMSTSPALSCRGASCSGGRSQAEPWVTTVTLSGASSSIRIDQGGSSTIRITKALRARGPSRKPASRSHRIIVDDKRGIEATRTMESLLWIGSDSSHEYIHKGPIHHPRHRRTRQDRPARGPAARSSRPGRPSRLAIDRRCRSTGTTQSTWASSTAPGRSSAVRHLPARHRCPWRRSSILTAFAAAAARAGPRPHRACCRGAARTEAAACEVAVAESGVTTTIVRCRLLRAELQRWLPRWRCARPA